MKEHSRIVEIVLGKLYAGFSGRMRYIPLSCQTKWICYVCSESFISQKSKLLLM